MFHALTILFLVAVVSHLSVRLWLSVRQVRHVRARRDEVPPAFADSIAPEEHHKAADYTAERQRLGRWEIAWDTLLLLIFTIGGGIERVGSFVAALGFGTVATGTLHVLSVFTILAIASLPFSVWRTFVLEARFGFNRTTPRIFFIDLVKGALLGALLGGAITATVLWAMATAGRAWWAWAWAAWMLFSLVLLWAWPRWIAGLFNRFVPLQDAPLRERIDALLGRCGFRAKDVYVMDGSKRSAHGNAYFTGLGREKRIVFFDTLLQTLSPVQVEAVLAHELAHFKLRHIPQRLLVSAAMSFAGFALLGWMSTREWFYQSLGVQSPGNSAALLLFLMAVPAFTWVVSPLAAAWSRRHEYQADEFAAKHSNGPELAGALVSMYRDNASTLTPDPLYSAFYDSHPPPVARIARLLSAAGRSGPLEAGPTAAHA
jgi:STE24 endopeptidase